MELITPRSKLRDGGLKVDFFMQYLTKAEADNVFRHLESSLEWYSSTRRQKYTFGDSGLKYVIYFSNGVKSYETVPWANLPVLLELKERLEKVVGHTFTTCVVQRYPKGRVGIKRHRDKEMKPGTTIVGLSVGATRYLELSMGDRVYNIDLPHGSVYILRPPTNDWWAHAIPPDDTVSGVRYSLTFRNY